MSISYRDLVMEFCYTTGTGALTLAGTANGFRTALTAWGAGDHESHWVIRHPANGQWEVFRGTVNGTGLTRTEVLASSNGGSLVDFSPGRKEVRCTLPASVFEPVLLPTADTTEIVRDPVDDTKRMRIDVGAVATATTRVVTVPNQDVDLTPNSGTFPAATHATRHQHGGADEIATVTPAANAIPKAGAGGTLTHTWLTEPLSTIGGLTPVADRFPYWTGTSSAALAVLTPAARNLLDDTTATAMRDTLELGTAHSPQFDKIGIGSAAGSTVGIAVGNTNLTSTVQIGVAAQPVGTSAATSFVVGQFSKPALAAASFTCADLTGFLIDNPAAFSGGASATRLSGIYILDQTRGGSNFGVRCAVSAGTNKWNWYGDGTANNLMNGPLILGSSAAPTVAADQAAMHAIDAAAGNRCIGWKTENGQTGKLYTVATYTPTNVTTDRTFDANSTTLDEIADVLGTLIADLKLTGLLA